ncbi:hypothetical protein OB955_00100 [Halobacteria archaeon AArc-m2/3/4]|uniref:Protein NO VEIN C-terminal domain-containing protein n=1 Tax=Natronoglomus mannanivorans TaxID=2979990 RepID=A0ABT2Q894_9EURY|nr:hypothetical protein [Halobacteria archaeon AArc-m2/3/4]
MSITTAQREKSLATTSPVDIPLYELPVIELIPDQLRTVDALAEDRNESYKEIDGGVVFGKNDALTSHQIGILGEIAVAHRYNVEIDTETYRFGDDGTDLVLGNKTVDVKATATDAMRYPQLLVRTDKELTADLYFRVHVLDWGADRARVRLLGYASKERVTDRKPRRHPGTKENYVVEPEELTLPPCVRI